MNLFVPPNTQDDFFFIIIILLLLFYFTRIFKITFKLLSHGKTIHGI